MNPNCLPICVTGVLSFLLVGCSDPAANVQKAEVSAAVAVGENAAEGRTYLLRPDSTIGFIGSKVTGSHAGGFTNVAGKIQVKQGMIVGTPEFRIDMNSAWTDNERLTGHLKSADFFDVAAHPQSTFVITSVETGFTNSLVKGNLNLHGVAKGISFPAAVDVTEERVLVTAEFAINRKDFNINYAGKADDLIRDQVVIRLDLKASPEG